jgi:hypothetical protein
VTLAVPLDILPRLRAFDVKACNGQTCGTLGFEPHDVLLFVLSSFSLVSYVLIDVFVGNPVDVDG